MFLHETDDKIEYFAVKLREELLVESFDINFVIDYIVINFSKSKENEFYEQNFGDNITGFFIFIVFR